MFKFYISARIWFVLVLPIIIFNPRTTKKDRVSGTLIEKHLNSVEVQAKRKTASSKLCMKIVMWPEQDSIEIFSLAGGGV